MSCCLYWVILEERLSVRVLARTTVGCFYAKIGDVAACRVVCIGLYLKSA